MATHTFTADLGSLLEETLTSPDGIRARAYLTPYGGAVTSGSDTLIGSAELTLDTDDAFSVVVPEGAYTCSVVYVDPGPPPRLNTWTSGTFLLDGDKDLTDAIAEAALLYTPVRGVTYHATATGALPLTGETDHELNLTGNTTVTLTGPVGVEIGIFVHFNGFSLTVNGEAISSDDPGTVVAKLWDTGWRIYISASISGGVIPSAPDDISGLQLWYDASAVGALTMVSTKVSAWRNDGLIGSAGNLAQATDAQRPLTTTINGLTAVNSPDATRDLDKTSVGGGLDTLPCTVWGVVKINANTAGTLTGGSHTAVKLNGSGGIQGVSSTGAGVVIPAAYAIGDLVFVALVVAASGPAKLWVGSASNSATITLDGGLSHWFGCNAQAAYCEMGAYDTALTDSQIGALYAGLQTKWGTL